MSKKGITFALAALQACAVIQGAAASDRNDTDFIGACVASSNLPEAVCACSAAKARSELSPDGFSLLVATLEGDEAAAAKLRSNLPMDQIVKASTFMVRGPAACAGGASADG